MWHISVYWVGSQGKNRKGEGGTKGVKRAGGGAGGRRAGGEGGGVGSGFPPAPLRVTCLY